MLPVAADAVVAAIPWVKDLKQSRDPVAHRIPLYIPLAVLNEVEAGQVRMMHARADRELRSSA
jgi:hypothetical protein